MAGRDVTEKLPQLERESVVRETRAPESADEWRALADDAVREAAEIIRRFRGEGYR